MHPTLHAGFLPHDGPDAALALHRDTLGSAVRDCAFRGPAGRLVRLQEPR
ncbi:hypothetical protein ACH4F6_27870 [Streptomyces sp. NPDC017936]